MIWTECLHALAFVAFGPIMSLVYRLRNLDTRAWVRDDLENASTVDVEPTDLALPDRPLKVFVSCAEPSGQAHGMHLVEMMREELAARGAPEPIFYGLGGQDLAALGVEIVGDPTERAAMLIDPVHAFPFYFRLLKRTAKLFRDEQPDVCLPIDSPALHAPMGRIAHAYGIPVVHFVTPQYWAWAPWRVGRYRDAVDLGLTILPFEKSWFARHGATTSHVGHPQLELLKDVPTRPDAQKDTLVILPGSRSRVIARNLPWMLVAAARMRLALPDLEVVIAHSHPGRRELLERHVAAANATSWVRIEAEDLHAELARARVALSVSGTILLDVLHHRIPVVSIYRLGNAVTVAFERWLLDVPWFSSVNLVAAREVVPEYCFHGTGPLEEVSDYLTRAYRNAPFRGEVRQALEEAARRLGPPGATRRAALFALSRAC